MGTQRWGRWAIAASLCLAVVSDRAVSEESTGAAVDDEADSVDRDYSAALTRVPATEPDAVLKSFQVEPGFRIELAAAEPAVADPVAMEFDEFGRLWVVEMCGYSENAAEKIGQIRVLEDADRDGTFEKSTLFVDGLLWPTAILCYDGGVFVGDAPDILYLKDTDGDGKADERRVVFTGFKRDNVQGLLNSFRWGPDNRIHVAASRNGADLRRGDQPDAAPLVLRGRNFAFDPRTLAFEATSGASQHGMCFDPWGNLFTCHNSDHIQQSLIDDRYLSRNPYLRPAPALVSIAVEGPAADVFRISPVEPWRIVRTRLRAKGIVPGVVEGGGRPAGYFTSATGVTIYTGDAWPATYRGNAFIGDVGSNLIHRKTIETDPDAVPLVARRATEGREFIASTDPWFRPVQYANAPDGNLYVLDMYREVIEHPDSLPPVLKKHIDLTSGRDRGRIYRVLPADWTAEREHEQLSRKLPGGATTAELVAMLDHPNGWHRTTAARLLFEQGDPATSGMVAELLAKKTTSPEGRVRALGLLNSLGGLDGDMLAGAMINQDARVRAFAVGLAGQWLAAATAESSQTPKMQAVERALAAAAGDADRHVRFQAALALGAVEKHARAALLAGLIARDATDEYMRTAALASLDEGAAEALVALASKSSLMKTAVGQSLVLELARQIGARGDATELTIAAPLLATDSPLDRQLARQLLVSLLTSAGPKRATVRQVLSEATGGETDKTVAALIADAVNLATDDEAKPEARAAAAASLPLGSLADAADGLATMLQPQQPQNVQLAAVDALGQFADPAVAEPLLKAWTVMSPTVRQAAIKVLLARAELSLALLNAIEAGKLTARDLDPTTIQQLHAHADAKVRDLAQRVLEQNNQARAEIVAAYQPALELAGDVDRGREIFRKNCAACHRREGFGTEVGADLATVVGRTPEALVISILDPNREVDQKYIQYSVLTVDGVTTSGMISAETAASVTLTRAEKETETIVREDIDVMESTGLTLMPEGFEKLIDVQGMADLIAFLRNAQ
jgi:putative membrane-bound dehydrogenase-like protein